MANALPVTAVWRSPHALTWFSLPSQSLGNQEDLTARLTSWGPTSSNLEVPSLSGTATESYELTLWASGQVYLPSIQHSLCELMSRTVPSTPLNLCGY
jgi:hypothetical protein